MKKTCTEELKDAFTKFAQRSSEDIPEIGSVLLIVDWKVGNNDLPPSYLLANKLNTDSCLSLLEQIIKVHRQLLTKLSSELQKVIDKVYIPSEEDKTKSITDTNS